MRDILVPMTAVLPLQPHVEYAARLAKAMSGSLTGLYALQPFLDGPELNTPSAIGTAVAYLLEQRRAAAEGEVPFLAWARSHGVGTARWSVITGPYSASIARAAAWHDCVVVRATTDSDAGSLHALGEVLLTCGIPCIVVPDAAATAPVPRCVAVAWNGSAESVRVLRAAMPLLLQAQEVVILASAHPVQSQPPVWDDTFDLVRYLADAGCRARRHDVLVDSEHAGPQLLRESARCGAQMLVMGAYGRSRFSEWVLGGATRHVLANSPVPVLFRH
ncbi:universal stress protein [Tahibacter amnicola]|uniref:Universal stress protein n=1 Tax=Tahibacter amnicola TaxID=2976241 RepID=A0ABY6BCW2_9GAMM|nr:universal stress protein [Tahibacter amnicola]UXI66461.1 universal stress protein [Tahibacter amnicola]